jgi:1-deoxy-D-xylulose-5-phosphate synthase
LPDKFIDHGDPLRMLADCGLNQDGIVAAVSARMAQFDPAPRLAASPAL